MRCFATGASDESGCEMKRLWVDGAFRGFGLGRRLVQEALRGRREWD